MLFCSGMGERDEVSEQVARRGGRFFGVRGGGSGRGGTGAGRMSAVRQGAEFGAFQTVMLGLAKYRNRSDFCDLPEIAAILKTMLSNHYAALRGLSVRWRIACDLRFRAAISEPKPVLSAEILAIWLRQRGNR